MVRIIHSCPDTATLDRLMRGEMSDPEAALLADHLLECDRCAGVVATLSGDDPLVEAMRAQAAAHLAPPSAGVESLIERLTTQVPTATAAGESGVADDPADWHAMLLPPQQPDEIGRFGPYRVRRTLGHGGMGVVFAADDPQLRRTIAVKILKPVLAACPSARRRFLREARAVASLQHDHVVTVHQVGEERGFPFLTMPLLAGESLQARLRRDDRLPVAEVLQIGMQTARGLAAAHARGLVHRDVNPANLWLEAQSASDGALPYRVKVMDFGLVRAAEDGPLTEIGTVMGTPPYLAPEQARGQALDARADLFSLGCVLYRAVTGQAAFRGTDAASFLTSLVTDQPTPPHRLNPAVPEELSALILCLLAKDPAARPRSADEVAAALRDIASRQERPATSARQSRPWKILAIAAAVLLLVGGLLAGQVIIRIRNKDGSETVVKVPPDSGVTFEQDGKVVVTIPPNPIAAAPSLPTGPMDRLDPTRIPAAERFAWQPKELVAVLGEHRGWHVGAVTSVAYSPDGKWLASCGTDGLVRFWDPATLHLRASLSGQAAGLRAVAFAPDSKMLASGGTDKTVRLWDVSVSEPKLRSVLRRNITSDVLAIAFSPDGKVLACSHHDGSVQLWSLAAGTASERSLVKVGKEAMTYLAFAPNSQTLAAGGSNGTLHLWDLTGPQPKARSVPAEHKQRINGVAFAPDGKTLASCSWDSTLLLWDLTGPEIRERSRLVTGQPYGRFNALAYAPDGQTLAASCADGIVRLWDVGGSEPKSRNGLRPQNSSSDEVYALAFSPDSQTLATGSWDTNIKLWDLSGAQPKRRAVPAGHTDLVRSVAFSPDGAMLATAGLDPAVRLWDLTGAEPRVRSTMVASPRFPSSVAFSADGKTLAEGTTVGPVRLWDLTATEPKVKTLLEMPPALVGRPALLIACKGTALGTAAEPGPGQAIAKAVTRVGSGYCALALSADGKTLASGGEPNGPLRLWDLSGTKPKERGALKGHAERVLALAVAPDGRTLAYASADRTVRLWDLSGAEPRERAALRHDGHVFAVAFTPDGRTLASAGSDGRLILWDTASGKKQRELTLPGCAFCVAFAPDGRHLATAHANGTVYILRLAWPPTPSPAPTGAK